MHRLFETTSNLEANRLRNWLVQHEIDATIRLADEDHGDGPSTVESPTHVVCVPDEAVENATVLLAEFQNLFDDAADVENSSAEESDDQPEPEKATTSDGWGGWLKGMPWLTIAYCTCCWGASLGWWREVDPESQATAMKWGWRDVLAINAGNWWSIPAASLLDFSSSYLLRNTLAILIFGGTIERKCGRLTLCLLLIAGMFTGVSADMALLNQTSVGATGAVALLFGFVVTSAVHRRLAPWWFLGLASAWIGYQLLIESVGFLHYFDAHKTAGSVSSSAPIVSFLAGVVIAVVVAAPWRRLWKGALLTILAAIGLIPLFGAPWNADWLVMKSDDELRTGSPERAIDLAARAVARSNCSADAYNARGVANLLTGDFANAQGDFESALKSDAESSYAASQLATLRLLDSDIEGALEELRQAMLRTSMQLEVLFSARSAALQSRGDYGLAEGDLNSAISLAPAEPAYRVQRALLMLETSRWENSLRDADAALQVDPDHWDALLIRGEALLEMGRVRSAGRDLSRAEELLQMELRRRPRDLWLHMSLAETQGFLFLCDSSLNRLSDAQHALSTSLELAPRYWEVWRLRGWIEWNQSRFESAERSLDRAIELNSRDSDAYSWRGKIRSSLGRYEDALADLNEAINRNPRGVRARLARADVLRSLERNADALADLNEAVKLDRRYIQAFRDRSRLWSAMGDEERSRDDALRATELEADERKHDHEESR